MISTSACPQDAFPWITMLAHYHDTRQGHAVGKALQLEKVSLMQILFGSHICASLSDQDFRRL